MKLEGTGMHFLLFSGGVIIWGAFRFVSLKGKIEETNQLSEKRLVEGGRGGKGQRSFLGVL